MTYRRLAIVTSEFHMPRTEAIFRKCFQLASKSLLRDPASIELTFHSAHDELSEDVLDSRRLKEAESLQVQPLYPSVSYE